MTFNSRLLLRVIMSTLGWRFTLYRSMERTNEILSVLMTLPKVVPDTDSSGSM
ncbi:hypothetical protein D3C80_2102570 [compost metagenome]